jgi:hypothetical protein
LAAATAASFGVRLSGGSSGGEARLPAWRFSLSSALTRRDVGAKLAVLGLKFLDHRPKFGFRRSQRADLVLPCGGGARPQRDRRR